MLVFVTVKLVELHHRAKFCRNGSNRGRDIAIFRFSRWRINSLSQNNKQLIL